LEDKHLDTPSFVRRALAVATFPVALASCAVGPDFHGPAVPPTAYVAPPASVGRHSVDYGGGVAADWYTLFHSEALDRLVHEALAANPDLEAARHNLFAAQYELQAVAGSLLPRLELDARVAREKVNGSYLFEPVDRFQVTANQFNIGPVLAYDVDVFGRIRRGIEAQAAQTANAEHQALNVYVTLVDQVVLTAFDYAAAAGQIQVTRQLIDDLEQQYQLTGTLEAAGKITRSDTLQAQSQLESTRSTLPTLEKQQDIYRNALLRLLGKTTQDDAMHAVVPDLSLPDFALPPRLPVSLPSQLVKQRPDILAAEDTLHQASAEIGVAEAARLPSLSLSGQYAQQSTVTSDLFTKAGSIWAAGASITAPIFEGGTLRARERRPESASRRRRRSIAGQ
jgi:NodT family efflux transporter outer membrane factor (OMF) lipoprotein